MNPGIVSAAVVVVGAIAAALYYVFNDAPQPHTHHNPHQRTRPNDYNFYLSDRSNGTANETRNRRKPRKTVKRKNDECIFCLEKMFGTIAVLSCEHAYHQICMDKFIESERRSNAGHPPCPLCREPIITAYSVQDIPHSL